MYFWSFVTLEDKTPPTGFEDCPEKDVRPARDTGAAGPPGLLESKGALELLPGDAFTHSIGVIQPKRRRFKLRNDVKQLVIYSFAV